MLARGNPLTLRLREGDLIRSCSLLRIAAVIDITIANVSGMALPVLKATSGFYRPRGESNAKIA
jgi:hypothetical protein